MEFAFPIFLAARLDWGFGNPNKTATLIGMLMVAVWTLPFLRRRLFWLALLLFSGLGVCLMQTASRGGVLAAGAGMCLLLAFSSRPWPRAYVIGSMASVWIIVGAATLLQSSQRFGKGIVNEDRSISQRLVLWRAAPRMMVDAPGGWGLGNSANAFQQWYQPLDQNQAFLSLINSHLTWLVEIGWVWRYLYVFGWLAALALCWPHKSDMRSAPWPIIPFTIWIVFAIAAWFSSVAESTWLWALPAISLVCVLFSRWKTRQWPQCQAWARIGLGSCAVLGGIFYLGWKGNEPPRLRLKASRIVLGDVSSPDVWVVTNISVLGRVYGRTLRQHFKAASDSKSSKPFSLGLVNSVNELPVEEVQTKTLVIAGMLTASELAKLKILAPKYGRLLLLNPVFFPQDLGVDSKSPVKIEVLSGEFSQTPTSAWASELKHPASRVIGAGDFLANWPDLVLVSNQL
jgi:hypothetical protein